MCTLAPNRRITHEAPHCRALSADLWLTDATKDLMTVFVDCLVRLPNLKTLEVFSVNRISLVTGGLKRERALFPSIRELWVGGVSTLIRSCPNVESMRVMGGFFPDIEMLCLHGKNLRRVAGVYKQHVWRGELRHMFSSEASIHRGYHHGSRRGLSEPPRDLRQGYNLE